MKCLDIYVGVVIKNWVVFLCIFLSCFFCVTALANVDMQFRILLFTLSDNGQLVLKESCAIELNENDKVNENTVLEYIYPSVAQAEVSLMAGANAQVLPFEVNTGPNSTVSVVHYFKRTKKDGAENKRSSVMIEKGGDFKDVTCDTSFCYTVHLYLDPDSDIKIDSVMYQYCGQFPQDSTMRANQ